jgi:hypothetical protein
MKVEEKLMQEVCVKAKKMEPKPDVVMNRKSEPKSGKQKWLPEGSHFPERDVPQSKA